MARRNRLSAPQEQTYYIAVALAVVGVILEVLYKTGTKLAGVDMPLVAFLFVLAGFILLALANLYKRL